jgi:hypothetical protein
VPFCYHKLLPLLQAMDLLELLVCGSIVALDIPLRVVQHELWRNHILESNGDDYESDTETEVCLYVYVTRLLQVLEYTKFALFFQIHQQTNVMCIVATGRHSYDANSA